MYQPCFAVYIALDSMSKLGVIREQMRGIRTSWLIGIVCAYLVVCLCGALLLLSFDIALPMSTGAFFAIFFLVGPVALLIYGVLEAVCEAIAMAAIEGSKWLGRSFRKWFE
jgi:hypothetical protein